MGVPVLRHEQPRHQPKRCIADHHRAGLRNALEARRDVRRIPERERLLLLPAPHLSHDDRTGVDAHVPSDRHPVLRKRPRTQLLEIAQHVAPRTDRSLRIFLMGLRIAEIDQQAVAQVLRDVARVAFDDLGGQPLIGTHDLAIDLGVEALG